MTDLYRQLTTKLDTLVADSPKRWVVALSGGVDSCVLLDLLARDQTQFGGHCVAVHVHHGLSKNADAWANQCQSLCQHLNVEFKLEKVDLGDIQGELVRKDEYGEAVGGGEACS